MNANKQMEVIQEAAGECRHESDRIHTESGRIVNGDWCIHCDIDPLPVNPSPDDLNSLFGYAEKLVRTTYNFPEKGIHAAYDIDFEFVTEEGIFCRFIIHYHEGFNFKGEGDTPAEALRNALVKAIEGRTV